MKFITRRMVKNVKKLYTLKLPMTPTEGMALYNRKCHLNAVEAVLTGKAEKVVECVVIIGEGNEAVVHFINIDFDGNYVDYTLGRQYLECDYHFVRVVDASEYGSLVKALIQAKFNLVSTVVPKWVAKMLPTEYMC